MIEALAIPEEWLVRTALAGGVLLLFGAGLMLCTRQPARRQRFGELALASSLLVAALCALPAWLPYSLPLWRNQPDPVPGLVAPREETPAPQALSLSLEPVDDLADLGEVILIPVPDSALATEIDDAGSTDSVLLSEPAAPAVTRSPWTVEGWLSLPGCLYFCVAIALLLRCLMGYAGLWRLCRASQPAPDWVSMLFADLTRHWPRRPHLRVCPRLALPVSFGVWRPTILLPPAFCRTVDEDGLRWVLVHELTHLERRDAWSCLLAALAQAVYFYVPWFWWLRRQLRLCQEYVADATAAAIASSEDYAQYLVSLSQLAPQALPAGARVTGVLGNHSDLFRRVAMLLNSTHRLERRCPRFWTLAAAGGFLAVAMLVSGIGLRAQAAPPDQDKEPAQETSKDNKSKEAKLILPQGVEPIRVLTDATGEVVVLGADEGKSSSAHAERLKKLQAELARLQEMVPGQSEEIAKHLKEAQKQLEQAIKQAEEASAKLRTHRLQLVQNARTRKEIALGHAVANKGVLGVMTETPADILVEQLGLTKGEGLVITQVVPETPAAKAGLKPHDIIVRFADKPVPSDPPQFAKFINDLAPKTDEVIYVAIIVRKGKRDELKVKLAPATIKQGQLLLELKDPNVNPDVRFRPSVRANTPAGGTQYTPSTVYTPSVGNPLHGLNVIHAGGAQVVTTVFRENERFTTRHQEGSLIITITGTVTDGKARIGEIVVQDGGMENKYSSLDKVPDRYRDKAKNLVDMSEKGQVKFDVKIPAK